MVRIGIFYVRPPEALESNLERWKWRAFTENVVVAAAGTV